MSDKKELAKLVTTLNKKFGTNAVTLGCPRDAEGELLVMDRIPTGSLSLNHSLGGGLPVGRFIEISGHESASKTTESLHIIREAQKKGFTCALLDVEGTTDDTYLKAVGVDVESLIYMNPDGLEEATQALIDMQRSGLVQLAVLDSIASLEPTRVIEKDMDETDQLGQKPKLLGKYFGVFTAGNNRLVREGNTPFTLVATNQLREKIGTIHCDPNYAPGGKAKEYFSSVNIRLRKGDWISEGTGQDKEIVGQVVKYLIPKNKTYKRMQTGEFDFYFAENSAGVAPAHNDNIKEIIMLALTYGVIERRGAWFYISETDKYNGTAPLVEALKNDQKLFDSVHERMLEASKRVVNV